jgi:hypothetical protein
LPLVSSRGLPPLLGTLVLAASIAALILVPSLLPPAIALYGAELVVSVHRGVLTVWSVPLLAGGLLVVYEAGELRHRLPSDSVVEAGAVRALTRRVGLTAALGLIGSAAVIGAASLSHPEGPAAAVVGGIAVAVAVLLVRILAATTRVD